MSDLLKKIDALETSINKSNNLFEIRNLMNKYLFYLSSFDANGVLGCFALNDENVSVEFGDASCVGKENIIKFFKRRNHYALQVGALFEHGAASSNIEIAEDEKTARMIIVSAGHRCNMETETQVADMGRYYVELLNTSCGWKIWHLQWVLVSESEICLGPLMQSNANMREVVCVPMGETLMWDSSLTLSNNYIDYFQYDEIMKSLPEVPDPYKQYDGYKVLKNTRPY